MEDVTDVACTVLLSAYGATFTDWLTRVHKNREYIEPNVAVGKAGHKWKTADMSNPFGWSVVATHRAYAKCHFPSIPLEIYN